MFSSHEIPALTLLAVHRLSEQQLRNLRMIVLDEGMVSAPRSVCHVRGLIPFCRKHPDIRIERRVSLFTNLLYNDGHNNIWILGSEVVDLMASWIEETLRLPTFGMPAGVFELVIDGTSRESREA
jgi:hypothetical protein